MEIVRNLVDAWNHQDAEGILGLVDPDVEYVNLPTAVEPGTRRGRDEFATVLRNQWEGLPDALQQIDRAHVRGDVIITEGHISRTMPGSDARIGNPVLISWKFRDGRIIGIEPLGVGTTS